MTRDCSLPLNFANSLTEFIFLFFLLWWKVSSQQHMSSIWNRPELWDLRQHERKKELLCTRCCSIDFLLVLLLFIVCNCFFFWSCRIHSLLYTTVLHMHVYATGAAASAAISLCCVVTMRTSNNPSSFVCNLLCAKWHIAKCNTLHENVDTHTCADGGVIWNIWSGSLRARRYRFAHSLTDSHASVQCSCIAQTQAHTTNMRPINNKATATSSTRRNRQMHNTHNKNERQTAARNKHTHLSCLCMNARKYLSIHDKFTSTATNKPYFRSFFGCFSRKYWKNEIFSLFLWQKRQII